MCIYSVSGSDRWLPPDGDFDDPFLVGVSTLFICVHVTDHSFITTDICEISSGTLIFDQESKDSSTPGHPILEFLINTLFKC